MSNSKNSQAADAAPVFRTAYAPFVVIENNTSGPSMTQQQFADECDYNTVLHNWQVSGLLTHVNPAAPQYGDLTEVPVDLLSAMDLVNQAKDEFMKLPSKVRQRFGNDPVNFLTFMQDPANVEEALALGLVEKAPLEAGGAERPHEAGVAPPASEAPA